MVHNRWIYFEIVRGCYGLPQSGMLANNLLHTRLNKNGYFEATTTPGIWKYQCQPIQFCFIVGDFVPKYVGERHIHHLRNVLKQHCEITEDWKGTTFAGNNIKWNYAQKHAERLCRLCIKDYIKYVLLRFGHKVPHNPQLSPHKHHEITYGSAHPQMTHIEDTSPPLDKAGIKRIQAIVGAVLFYGRSVDNKLLDTLNSIGT